MGRWLCTCLWISALVSAVQAEEDANLSVRGGTHVHSGVIVEREIEWTGEAASIDLSWRLRVYRATVAQGMQTLTRAKPTLSFRVPPVLRRIPARLVLAAKGKTMALDLTLHPDPRAELLAAFESEPVGWLGEVAALRVGPSVVEPARVSLETVAAVRAFPGRILVVPPRRSDVSRFLPALIARARQGARVLALGVDRAPWIDAERTASESPPSAAGNDLAALWPSRHEEVGRRRTFWKSPLAEADGNHVEWVADLVRTAYLGRGSLTLVRGRVLETLAEEPRSALLLVQLLLAARDEMPTLRAPRRVVAFGGSLPASVDALFGAARGPGRAVLLVLGEAQAKVDAKEEPAPIVLHEDVSRVGDPASARSAPGWRALEGSDRPQLLRFLTLMGLRVETETFWRR